MCDIAHTNGTPVSFEASRWTDSDLTARQRSIDADAERCPQCRLSPEASHWVTAVTDRCPTCEARDSKRREIGKLDNSDGMFVRWHVFDDPEQATHSSAFAQFTAEGAQARRVAKGQASGD